jgi:hypothetical protein
MSANRTLEDGRAVVEARDGVDFGVVEQVPTASGRAGIVHETGRHHETDAAVGPCELQRALDKELIPVDVGLRGHAINAGLADEAGQLAGELLAGPAHVIRSAVAFDHVPGGIANHGIESRTIGGGTPGAGEHFRKYEGPVQKASCACDRLRHVEKRFAQCGR